MISKGRYWVPTMQSPLEQTNFPDKFSYLEGVGDIAEMLDVVYVVQRKLRWRIKHVTDEKSGFHLKIHNLLIYLRKLKKYLQSSEDCSQITHLSYRHSFQKKNWYAFYTTYFHNNF